MTLPTKTILRFASEEDAFQANALVGEAPGFEDVPLVLREDSAQWVLECYDGGALAIESIASLLEAAGLNICSRSVEAIPAADWVTETQKALPPVRAGRFTVHGSHDRGQIVSQWAIEIDAGRAFGTAHHGTTKGCLLALDELAGSAEPYAVLDLGTGSGVLAIAAAKAFPYCSVVVAADLDPIAIDVARENCRKNGASGIRLFVGDGMKPSAAYRPAPFDIVMANILAKPLLKLAPRLRELTQTGGVLMLSGLLNEQAREMLARYRATGFSLIKRRELEGWSTLLLRRVS